MRRCRRGLRSTLVLEDGLVVEGCGFGSPGVRVGELVFTTSMVGYPESLTDPSFKGQMLVVTHPLVGNYGVPSKSIGFAGLPANYESDRIQVEALIVAYETDPSHWASELSLHEWLRSEGVPGVSNVDTRMLVKRIRERGVVMAAVAVYRDHERVDPEDLRELLKSSERYDSAEYVDQVSPPRPVLHTPPGEAEELVVMLDCGTKYGILRELLRRRLRVLRVPCRDDVTRYLDERGVVGVVLSNGPGNPAVLKDVIANVAKLLELKVPVLGICLGHQLLALAAGASTFKLKYGHRGANKPVRDLLSGRCYVTSQNHGYAVDPGSLRATGFKVWMVNADDGTVEAMIHERLPVITTQFHPEASPGPLDTTWVFDYYLKVARKFGGAF